MMAESGFVEVIREGEIVQMPRQQALEEDLFILRDVIEPAREVQDERQPRAPQRVDSGVSRLDRWKRGDVVRGNNVVGSLKTNFHWEISKKRRGKGMTRNQLAVACGVSEEEIKSIELGELPRDDFVLVNKIEQVLGIMLRKEGAPTSVSLSELSKMKEERDMQSAISAAGSDRTAHSGRTRPQPASEDTRVADILGDDIEIVG